MHSCVICSNIVQRKRNENMLKPDFAEHFYSLPYKGHMLQVELRLLPVLPSTWWRGGWRGVLSVWGVLLLASHLPLAETEQKMLCRLQTRRTWLMVGQADKMFCPPLSLYVPCLFFFYLLTEPQYFYPLLILMVIPCILNSYLKCYGARMMVKSAIFNWHIGDGVFTGAAGSKLLSLRGHANVPPWVYCLPDLLWVCFNCSNVLLLICHCVSMSLCQNVYVVWFLVSVCFSVAVLFCMSHSDSVLLSAYVALTVSSPMFVCLCDWMYHGVYFPLQSETFFSSFSVFWQTVICSG